MFRRRRAQLGMQDPGVAVDCLHLGAEHQPKDLLHVGKRAPSVFHGGPADRDEHGAPSAIKESAFFFFFFFFFSAALGHWDPWSFCGVSRVGGRISSRLGETYGFGGCHIAANRIREAPKRQSHRAGNPIDFGGGSHGQSVALRCRGIRRWAW